MKRRAASRHGQMVCLAGMVLAVPIVVAVQPVEMPLAAELLVVAEALAPQLLAEQPFPLQDTELVELAP